MLIGKGLGWTIYAQLASYVGTSATQQAFPLAILLASIMAMGNLGEHLELTALKSAGISLPRVLWPLFLFGLLLSALTFFTNSYMVPRARLNALSLLYDLGKKKPSIAIKEGIFYDGIPDYSIKVRKKLDDQTTMEGIMIYDHTQNRGNSSLTLAESGKIYTTQDEAYLVLELFNGHNYVEEPSPEYTSSNSDCSVPQFYRSNFKTQKLFLSLDSFKLARTQKELFTHHYRTKNAHQLATDAMSMKKEIQEAECILQTETLHSLLVPSKTKTSAISAAPVDLPTIANILQFKAYAQQQQHQDQTQAREQGDVDLPIASPKLYKQADAVHIYGKALEQSRIFRSKLSQQIAKQKLLKREICRHELERHKMLAWAVSCVIVLLVGAPLGAIIKKGGLGIPLLIAAGLIVWYYIFEMLGDNWADEGIIDAFNGAWLANWLLLPFGLFFLRQAYQDSRLLEAEYYATLLRGIKKYVCKVDQLFRPSRKK